MEFFSFMQENFYIFLPRNYRHVMNYGSLVEETMAGAQLERLVAA
jgi:hypothetical protein